MMTKIFLLSGSNLGESAVILDRAAHHVSGLIGRVVNKSRIYRSASWGYSSEKVYFNQCLEVETELSAHDVLASLLGIELKMGRVREGEEYMDRLIDLDILFYGKLVLNDVNLIIPHPRMHLRRFALVPLAEIAGDFEHPVFKKTVSALLTDCEDKSVVTSGLF